MVLTNLRFQQHNTSSRHGAVKQMWKDTKTEGKNSTILRDVAQGIARI